MRLGWVLLLAGLAGHAMADTLSQWDFNSDDANAATGTLLPSAGVGVLSLVGGTTDLFTFGSPGDPAVPPLDSSWSVGHYPTQGTASGTAGFSGFVSTVGFHDLSLSFDFRNQPSANKFFALQVSSDHGASWHDVATFGVAAADTWFSESFALSPALSSVDDNASFGFRIVAVFAPGTTQYEASEAGYNGAFGLQYDRLTLSGQPVPEPASAMTISFGLLGMLAALYVRRLSLLVGRGGAWHRLVRR